MPTETLDPNFYRRSQNQTCFPPRPLSVVGFTFDPATGTFDFSAVPDFDLSRLRSLWHANTGRYLYARPTHPLDFAAIDGSETPAPQTFGTVLKVRPDTSRMRADDEIIAEYDLSAT